LKTQYDAIARLLTRKRGCTAMEIISDAGTVCPHKRLSEMKDMGWTITRNPISGKTYGRYFGHKSESCHFVEQGDKDRGAISGN
jgi:hypothetical protein